MHDSVPSVHQDTQSLVPSSLQDPLPPLEPCLKTTDPPSPSSAPSQGPGFASVSRQEPASATVEDMESHAEMDKLELGSLETSEHSETSGSGEACPLPPQEPVHPEMDLSKTSAAKRTCSPPPENGHDAGGKRSPLLVVSDAKTTFDPPGLVTPHRMPSEQPTSEESMEEPERADDLERDQPEGGSSSSSSSSSNGNGSSSGSNSSGSGSNNIPSLAQALKELHQLLVSNRALSPSTGRLDADGLDQQTPATSRSPAPVQEAPNTDETLPPCPSETEPGHSADIPAPAGDPADAPEREEAVGCRPDTHPLVDMGDCDERDGQSEAQEAPPSEEDMTEREPPEGQQGRGEADGRDSGADAPDLPSGQSDQQRPLSLAVGSSSEQPAGGCSASSATSTPSTPSPLAAPAAPTTSAAERFPAEDIQRIQAAGFSAQEAVQALEQAQGCVELALLVLLARKISVPT
ncbi:protein DDI1 homolog 2 isoform X1 [Sardina pilchardus]|uniref:protein DDI1 homolog 2 isoform X1 n=1 Tax=Sardina pilchardus TaxID=27697 RepID=UPI002E15676B